MHCALSSPWNLQKCNSPITHLESNSRIQNGALLHCLSLLHVFVQTELTTAANPPSRERDLGGSPPVCCWRDPCTKANPCWCPQMQHWLQFTHFSTKKRGNTASVELTFEWLFCTESLVTDYFSLKVCQTCPICHGDHEQAVRMQTWFLEDWIVFEDVTFPWTWIDLSFWLTLCAACNMLDMKQKTAILNSLKSWQNLNNMLYVGTALAVILKAILTRCLVHSSLTCWRWWRDEKLWGECVTSINNRGVCVLWVRRDSTFWKQT